MLPFRYFSLQFTVEESSAIFSLMDPLSAKSATQANACGSPTPASSKTEKPVAASKGLRATVTIPSSLPYKGAGAPTASPTTGTGSNTRHVSPAPLTQSTATGIRGIAKQSAGAPVVAQPASVPVVPAPLPTPPVQPDPVLPAIASLGEEVDQRLWSIGSDVNNVLQAVEATHSEVQAVRQFQSEGDAKMDGLMFSLRAFLDHRFGELSQKLEAELAKSLDHNKTLEAELGRRQEVILEQQKSAERLAQTLSEAQQAIATLSVQHTHANDTIRHLESRVSLLQTEVDLSKRELDAARTEMGIMQEKFEASKSSLDNQLEERDTALTELQQKLTVMQEEAEMQESVRQRLLGTKDQLEEMCHRLSEDSKALESNLASAESERAQEREQAAFEVGQLKEALRTKDVELQTLKGMMSQFPFFPTPSNGSGSAGQGTRSNLHADPAPVKLAEHDPVCQSQSMTLTQAQTQRDRLLAARRQKKEMEKMPEPGFARSDSHQDANS
jgi:hypothetical protein